jgi:ankyrin repeat protein
MRTIAVVAAVLMASATAWAEDKPAGSPAARETPATPVNAAAAEVRDWRYQLTIHEIAQADDEVRLRILVTDNADRTRLQLQDGQTPVHVAAQAGSLKSLQVLAKAGADLNPRDGKKRTPLSLAIQADFTNTVKTLLDLGADANRTAATGDESEKLLSPLVLASRRGNVEVLKALLAAKADVSARMPDGSTPITAAAAAGHWPAVNLFLDHKADPNTRDARGVTALLIATEKGDVKEVDILLEKGADPRLTDRQGRAPLSLTQSPTLWKMLIDKGADVNVVSGGATPLQYFITAGKLDLVKAWLEYKPDPLVADRQGRTAKELALHHAAETSSSYHVDMERREIAQLVEKYQNKYAEEQRAKEAATQPK